MLNQYRMGALTDAVRNAGGEHAPHRAHHQLKHPSTAQCVFKNGIHTLRPMTRISTYLFTAGSSVFAFTS